MPQMTLDYKKLHAHTMFEMGTEFVLVGFSFEIKWRFEFHPSQLGTMGTNINPPIDFGIIRSNQGHALSVFWTDNYDDKLLCGQFEGRWIETRIHVPILQFTVK